MRSVSYHTLYIYSKVYSDCITPVNPSAELHFYSITNEERSISTTAALM
jgi:hypothetical protein